jgi:DNA-nicking Smr family endonuclease
MKKNDHIFNPAFKDLQQKITQSRKSAEMPRDKMVEKKGEEDADHSLFRKEMSNVTPLPGERGKIVRAPGANLKPSHPAPDEEKEVMAHLRGLVKGDHELDIRFSDEYMEGSVKGLDRRTMRRLRRGQFPVKDYVDLHGLTRQEAEARVKDFLVRSHRIGHRCVLIVHGRGLNSPDSFPVLKEGLPIWLNRGPIKRVVLAFATARPYDGGTGAIYVLLRKR